MGSVFLIISVTVSPKSQLPFSPMFHMLRSIFHGHYGTPFLDQKLRFYYEWSKYITRGRDFIMNQQSRYIIKSCVLLWTVWIYYDRSRFYYERSRFSWWLVEIFMMRGEVLLWAVEIFMMTSRYFHDDRWGFIVNGRDFRDDRSRFYFEWSRFSWRQVEIFMMTGRDFSGNRPRFYYEQLRCDGMWFYDERQQLSRDLNSLLPTICNNLLSLTFHPLGWRD